MNKYQEAIDVLNDPYATDERDEAEKVLQELIDKETPKKPIHKFVNVCFNLVDYTYCPNCVFSEVREYEHHCRCGQAIDWSE